jgi:hypothetical protein
MAAFRHQTRYSLQRLLDVSSEELLCAVLEFDPVEMTIGVANVFARVCNSVAPLNVTLFRAVSGGCSIGKRILVGCVGEREHNALGVAVHSFLVTRLGAEFQYAHSRIIESDFIVLW